MSPPSSRAVGLLENFRFLRKMLSGLQYSLPRFVDVIVLWMSYPFKSRCHYLREVVDLVSGMVEVSSYEAYVDDHSAVALDADSLMSSMHLLEVRSTVQSLGIHVRSYLSIASM